MFAVVVVLLNALSFASLAYVANRKGQHTMAALLAAGAWLFGVTGGVLIWGLALMSRRFPPLVVGRRHSEGYSRGTAADPRAEQSMPDPASAFAASSLILESGPLRVRLSRFRHDKRIDTHRFDLGKSSPGPHRDNPDRPRTRDRGDGLVHATLARP